MATTIGLIGTFTVNAGRLDDLRALAARMHATMRETGDTTRAHDWYVDAAGVAGMVREEYVDSEGALAHLAIVGELLGELGGLVTFTSISILGDPSPAFHAAFEAFQPAYLAPLVVYSSSASA